jgi:hypothetical protein
MLAARVISDLAARDTKRLGCAGQAELIPPAPTHELNGVGAPVLLERERPNRIGTQVDTVRPDNAMTALTERRMEECPLIQQWLECMSTKNTLRPVLENRTTSR